MKKLLIAMFLSALAIYGWAAMSDYSFEQNAATYTELTAPTVIHGPGIDDAMSGVQEIGFSFMLDETPYTQFKANSNGFITLNAASSASLSNNLASQTLIIAGIWDDLKTNDGDGQVAYLLSGTAPSRVLTVEYKNLKWYYNASPVNLVNFQIKLYEGSNRIEIVYGTLGTAPGTSATATIGVSGAALGNFMSITPADPTATWSTTTSFNSISGTHVPFMQGKKYSFIPPVPASNDLAATGITGNLTPSVNSPTSYTVTVFNRGSNAQSTYTVQLIDAANTVLASAPGLQIASGATVQVQVSWTPSAEGPLSIRGKVVLTGDENAANDISNAIPIMIMPIGVSVMTVGDGSQNIRMPIDFYYKNSLNETLYFPNEIGMFGNITAISLYNNFTTATLQNMPTKIWLGSTDAADLSAGWIPSTQLTQVFDGTVTYPAGENTILIPLQTPYSYTGGNLVLMFNRPMDTQFYSSMDYFKGQTIGINRARNVYSDGTTYDPANPGTVGTLTGQFAKTSFHMTPLSPDPIFSIMPASANYGTVLMDTVHNRSFTVLNAGGGNLTINSINISGSAFFTLQNMPTLPATLATGQNISFVARYNPTAAGTHTATITVTDNLARVPHTVALSGECIDTTILSLPYTQNFDAVTAPALPIDWSSVITGGTSPVVVTYTSSPYSTPNCVRIYNGSPAASNTILVAPPLATNIPVNTVRLKLWVKGVSATYMLSVGVMTNPADPATYTEVQSFATPTAWTEIVIPFNGFTGGGRYIAIKHGNTANGQTIYVDDAMIELIAANDLAVTALTGNTTPSVNAATTYTASIFNWGINVQTAYTVKLYNSDNVELASSPGVSVNPGQIVDVPITWTPTVEGPVTIYARLFLAGDQNPANDQSPSLNVTVMPAGMIVVTIGDGSQNIRMPLDFYYRNSINQTLYFPTEIGAFGNITAITLYNQFTSLTLQNMPTKIWMGSTDLADLSAGWIPSTQLTQVFDGTVTYPSGPNNIIIPLQVPFAYTGGNLVVMFNRPMDTQYYSSSDYFKGQTIGTNRARNVYSDSVTYDPANPGTVGTVTGQFAKTTLHMTPLSPDPLFAINPSTANYGTVLINTTHNRTFTFLNAGGGTLVVNNITISGSEYFSLQNLPTLPVSLTTGQNSTFVVRYNPTAAGAHTATITVTDNRGRQSQILLNSRNNGTRMPHTVTVNGNCIDTTVTSLPYSQNFDAVTAPALPVDWTSLVVPASTSAIVGTYATTPNSPPNCARINNGSTANTNAYLIAPPLATAIPVNTTRVKVWIKAGGSTYQMQVGVMSDPMNADSFVSVESVTPTTTWTEYIIGLNGYTGTGNYIAFKHMALATSQNIYLDDIVFEVIAPNDLGAVSLTGNVTPTAGAASVYTVYVKNWGTSAQSTYTVKLFNSENTELASTPGVAIQPGQILPVTLNWAPTAAGAMTIYGKVFLTGDVNPANDQTPNLNLLVNPSGVFTLTVGEGNQTARVPVDMFFKNSLFETLYYPAEMANFLGQINGIQFYNNFTTDLQNMPTKVWLGTTTQTDLSAGWIPSTQLTAVFDGTVNYPIGQNVITIPFAQPYLYLNGENLVLMVNRPMDTQYYASTNTFQSQTVGTNRARNIYSDSTVYDPASPPTTGSASGIFPKTTFFVIPGGVGHVNGTVLGAGNQPLAGVNVSIDAGLYTATTNASGQYQIMNVLPDTYQISFSTHGYQTLTQTFTLEEDETEVINVTMSLMAQVTLSGTILASDTAAGISGAAIHLTGYEDYSANTNAAGVFTFPAVFANNSYEYVIAAAGYTSASGTVNVGGTNHNMGNITLNEVAFAPLGVTAVANDTNSSVSLTWLAPDPNALEITESFEAETFPPGEWTRTVTNQGPPNAQGVYPTWCRFGAITISGQPANPTDGNHQAGLYWDYNHQDEWLITPGFNCPPSAYLSFDGYVFLGSTNQDHYYVKVTTDNGNNWTVLWDASAQTGGWNYYASPITIDLSLYAGQQIKLAFNAVDGPGNDGLWYVWFIDNIYIGNSITNIRFAGDQLQARSFGSGPGWNAVMPSRAASRHREEGGLRTEPRLPFQHEVRYAPRTDRVLTGYKVWRLAAGQEANEAAWAMLTPEVIQPLSYNDAGWNALPNGNYRWAVKAIYTNGVSSVAALSNVLTKETVTGMIAGVVRRQNTTPIIGATVIVVGTGLTATTNNAGAYTLIVPVGTHSVTASATGFVSQTVNDVLVNQGMTTTVNFVMVQGSDGDDPQIPVTATALNGNFPNPFNPETTISYSVKEAGPVRIEIYNLKGQLVRNLVNADQASGHYKVVFDGRDQRGQAIASGVYMIRMITPNYQSSKKMILMQ